MAQLLVSAALNIGAGLLLNFLFPQKQPDIVQEGPRLNDLDVTASTYGKTIPFHYGTVRTGGNVIWATPIEEVVTSETQEAGGKGGGGGGSVTTNTYTYFLSFAVSFGEGVAEDVLRIWADGKLIYEKSNTPGTQNGSINFRFYPGDETQQPDSLIEADRGAGNVPAHRGMCYIVFDRLPLANFGNRMPNITAEVAFKTQATFPFDGLTELAGQNIPGSSAGGDFKSHMVLDPFSNYLYFIKNAGDGLARVDMSTFGTVELGTGTETINSALGANLCSNGKIYMQAGLSNFRAFSEFDPISLQATGFTFGTTGSVGTWNGTNFNFPNGCTIGVLRSGPPGTDPFDIFVISGTAAVFTGDGGLVTVHTDADGALVETTHVDETAISGGRAGPVIQDYFTGRVFVVQEDDTKVDLWEVTAATGTSLDSQGVAVSATISTDVTLLGTYQKGGVDLSGTADIDGWCLLPNEDAVILSSSTSMIKVDLDDGSLLANNLTLGFRSRNQWTDTGLFAFGNGESGGSAAGEVYVIDTDDLSLQSTTDLGSYSFGDGIEANYFRSAYDPRTHALIYSRQHGTTPGSNRVVRILLDRSTADTVPLSDVVADLSRRAQLEDDDFDVSDLASETVLGYSVTRQGSVRSDLEPLQQFYLFEGAETDWKIKFVRRGGSPVVTIEEDDLGRLSTDSQEEIIRETRIQEVELPERVTVVYADRDNDYQQGAQHYKRISLPTPSQFSNSETELDVPIVSVATTAKQVAQRLLVTSWAQRTNFDTVLPWKYLAVDPTDIVNVNYRGETRRLRLAEVEFGADFSIQFTATQEDSESNTSALSGDKGSGLITQQVPSSFPTRFFPLDIPLLGASQASLQQFSRAYWAVSGYDSTWPGAILYHSRGEASTFSEVGAQSAESAWGVVVGTIPDPANTYTWDESATIDISVGRGLSRFNSASDDDVLAGANALAVIRGDGLPEIIQFVNVSVIEGNTIRLSRLLRGRRGTEPNAFNHSAAEMVVLLETGRTKTFRLPLDLIDVSTQYKAVTLGTALEDAVEQDFTYTGQDLVPYSPAQLEGTRTGNDLDINWVRRTRYNGELKDGTGEVPLNEQSESYDVEVLFGGEVLFSRTISDATTTTITQAEWEATGRDIAEVPLLNADFEDGRVDWTFPSGSQVVSSVSTSVGGTLNPQEGSLFFTFQGTLSGLQQLIQVVDLDANGYTTADIEGLTATVDYYHAETESFSTAEASRAILEALDENDSVLDSVDSGDVTPTPVDTWVAFPTQSLVLPVGTKKLKLTIQGARTGIGLDSYDVHIDDVKIKIGTTEIPPVQAKVYQNSAIVGRGRAADRFI